ncbi:hypothetical protein [Micavibrio aeruginosavorus]|uniref:hypothetical protein n=1 Tax=Micavibrio aeruginosavorus TaxID=349221 RepID=UPI003F4AD4F8
MSDQFPIVPDDDNKKPGTALVAFGRAVSVQDDAPDNTGRTIEGEFRRVDSRPKLTGPTVAEQLAEDEQRLLQNERAGLLRAAHKKAGETEPKESDTVFSPKNPQAQGPQQPLALPGPKADPAAKAEGYPRKIRCADGRYVYDYGHELRTREGKLSAAQAATVAELSAEKGWTKLYVYRGNGRTVNQEAAAAISAVARGAGINFNFVMQKAGSVGSHKSEALQAIEMVARLREAVKAQTPTG